MTAALGRWEGNPYDGTIPPEVWTLDTDGVVLVVCANGHVAAIPFDAEGWTVDGFGKVSPSILCATPMPDGSDCGWHVFATLEGWAS